MKEKLCLRQVTPSECVETKNVGLFLLYQKWAVKREPRWSCLRSCLKGLKGCLKRLTSAGGKKKWWRHHQISRDWRRRHSDQHDIQQETTEESFLVTRWVYKEPTKELHKISGQKTQVLLTMVLGKNWPAGPFLTSLFCWDSDGVGKLEKMNPRWEKNKKPKMPLSHHRPFVCGRSEQR